MKLALPLLLVLCPLVLAQTVMRDEYTPDGWFYRQDMNLGEVPNNIPGGARGVYLNNNNIETIRADDFRDMTALTFLGLHYNVISEIEANAFIDLKAVTELWLNNNRLRRLTADMFKGLTALDYLRLSLNPIDTIDSNAWRGLENLGEINFHSASLTEVRNNMFVGLSGLGELTLTNNKMFRIEEGSFKDLTSLKKLWLDSNRLREVTYGMFHGLSGLERLSLAVNNLTSITGGVFTGMFNLRILDLDDNQITEIRGDSFRGMDQLQEVWLYNNRLATFEANTLSGLPRSLSLTIGENPLQCDSSLCWMKQGYVTWLEFEERPLEPSCGNGISWNDLSCPKQADSCEDPGEIQNAVRSGSGPYKIGSEVEYTCDFCYMGSKTITCGSNGQWSDMPVCRPVQCPDPGQVSRGQRLSDGPFTCSYLVGYQCDEGYRMAGEAMLVCRGDATWHAPKPQCLPTDSTSKGQKVECKATLEETRWLIIAVVAGVGGLFLAVICTATCMECCRRRKRVK